MDVDGAGPDWARTRELRRDFPILGRKVRGKPLVYLDNAATTQKPKAVLDALKRYYEGQNANVHRGVHVLSEEATAAMEAARATVARFIGSPEPETVIFTRNATEAINLVAQSWGRANLKPGDEVLLTELEHHSNLVPWQLVAAATGATLKHVPMEPDGTLDLSALPKLLTPRTRLFAFSGMSNSLGTLNPVAELVRAAKRAGALVLVDGAQLVAHAPVDVRTLGIDFLAFSGHKMLGPTGIGVLWGRRELLEAMPPFLGGGDMIREVWLDRFTCADLPYKFEAGTPNIADAIALGAAVEYLEKVGFARMRACELELTRLASDALRALGATIYGPADPSLRGGVVSFNLPGLHPHDVGTILDTEGVAIRAGHHCTMPLMKRLGVPGTARASFYLYNTPEEVEALARAAKKAADFFAPKAAAR